MTSLLHLATQTDLERLLPMVNAYHEFEGIEEDDQAVAMRELGCTCFQGFYYGSPATMAEQDVEQEPEQKRKVA